MIGISGENLGIEHTGFEINKIFMGIGRIGQTFEMGLQVIGDVGPQFHSQGRRGIRHHPFERLCAVVILAIASISSFLQAELLLYITVEPGIDGVEHAVIAAEVDHVPTFLVLGHEFGVRPVVIDQMISVRTLTRPSRSRR